MKALRKRGFVTFEAVEAPRRMEYARRESKNTQKPGYTKYVLSSAREKNRMNGKKEEKEKKTA